uniref:NDUFA3 n=1 Tax=Euglena gracilis TaxID=3039 RepID=UPI002FE4FB24
MDRYEFQKIRRQPPTLHWEAGNRFENIQRLRWENAALLKDPKLTWFRREMLMRPAFFHCTLFAGAVAVGYPFVAYFYEKVFPDRQDFRSTMTLLRAVGGLEEQEYYIMERAKAIERAKARAAVQG